MGDHQSASLFGNIFGKLADKKFDKYKFAKWLWSEARGLDFWFDEMAADEELIELKLAKSCEDCGGTIYNDYEDYHECEEE